MCRERRRLRCAVELTDRFQRIPRVEQARAVAFGVQTRSRVSERQASSILGAGRKLERVRVETLRRGNAPSL